MTLAVFMVTLGTSLGRAVAQDWTLSKTANPTTYTTVGQVITYTYVVTNTCGDGTLTSLSDNKVSSISCPTSAIPQNTSLTCTGTYTITAADTTAGSVVNTATASGDACNDGCLRSATATATITFVPQPAWTLAKSANPTTYSGTGQAIAYSYVLRNTGNVGITAISLTDNKIATVSCPATSLAVGAGMTCTGSYTTTAGDVAAGSVTNTATATGTPSNGTLQPVTAQATIKATVPPTGSITIIKTASGGNNTFSFTTTLPGAATFTLATVSGTADRIFTSLTPGRYSVSEVELPRDWKLATLTCVGSAGAGTTVTDLESRRVTINLVGGDAVTCTFVNVFDSDRHRATTQRVIQRFLGNRNSLLATHEPDRSRFLRRVPGSLWGDGDQTQSGGANGPLTISGTDGDSTSRFSFATSLSQIAQARNIDGAMALGASAKTQRPDRPSSNGFDVWMEGHFSGYRDRADGVRSKGHFDIFYVGADYLLTPAILVGALVQFDWAGEGAEVLNSSVDGRGYMAGPYVSTKLTQHLFFDARVAWGSSDNSVSPIGTYQDQFSTDRWLAHAKLTGNWGFGSFRVTPSLGYTFIEEHQKSYTDALGVLIPSQRVSLGRLAFGPEIAYFHRRADGTVWEPHVSLQGVWDDTNTRSGLVGGLPVDQDDLRGMIQAGVLVRSPTGPWLRVVASYDGLGSSTGFRDLGGQVWVSIPLH